MLVESKQYTTLLEANNDMQLYRGPFSFLNPFKKTNYDSEKSMEKYEATKKKLTEAAQKKERPGILGDFQKQHLKTLEEKRNKSAREYNINILPTAVNQLGENVNNNTRNIQAIKAQLEHLNAHDTITNNPNFQRHSKDISEIRENIQQLFKLVRGGRPATLSKKQRAREASRIAFLVNTKMKIGTGDPNSPHKSFSKKSRI